ncbi:replication protein A 70 kDa DNA-binding subunit A-like [Cryptomeria japonica]|uniref:replication protein A 70 kDa DNA-binding subunit A-like n=1 Tax=Cryptomeria japonica TaxID=3369 RepID=UPI0025AC4AA2|nr:replication protein A 70 kDa DNA-binding subunit A-like [Cryptomeria japonica]
MKTVQDLCTHKQKKKMDPKIVKVIGQLVDVMLRNLTVPKYVDPGTPMIKVRIGNVVIPNTLIDMGVIIKVMTIERKEKLSIKGLRPTPTVLQMADCSVVKPKEINPTNNPYDFPIVGRNEASKRIIPIAALNSYKTRWTIKARDTKKGQLHHFNNAREDGKVFSFDLVDFDGDEIRVTCFNVIAKEFYDRIDIGRVFITSKERLKPTQNNFNHLNNEWEFILESNSEVEFCLEDNSLIPEQIFHLTRISEIENMKSISMVDIIGVVLSIDPPNIIFKRDATRIKKINIQLKDMSTCMVELTMWGGFCNKEGQKLQEMCNLGTFPILAIEAAQIVILVENLLEQLP